MNLIELMIRACDDAGSHKDTVRRAVAIVLRKWPTVRHFTDVQLQELTTELKGQHEDSL